MKFSAVVPKVLFSLGMLVIATVTSQVANAYTDVLNSPLQATVYAGVNHTGYGVDHAFGKYEKTIALNGGQLGASALYVLGANNQGNYKLGGAVNLSYQVASDKPLNYHNLAYNLQLVAEYEYYLHNLNHDSLLVRVGLGYHGSNFGIKHDLGTKTFKATNKGLISSLYLGYKFKQHYTVGAEFTYGSNRFEFADKSYRNFAYQGTVAGISILAGYQF